MDELVYKAFVQMVFIDGSIYVVTEDDRLAILPADVVRRAPEAFRNIKMGMNLEVILEEEPSEECYIVAEIKPLGSQKTKPPRYWERKPQRSEWASPDIFFAVVKSYNPAKGYGVVTLADGIAILRQNTRGMVGEIKLNTGMFVKLAQEPGGRMVSEIVGYGENWGEKR